jgi:hypothetical protein
MSLPIIFRTTPSSLNHLNRSLQECTTDSILPLDLQTQEGQRLSTITFEQFKDCVRPLILSFIDTALDEDFKKFKELSSRVFTSQSGSSSGRSEIDEFIDNIKEVSNVRAASIPSSTLKDALEALSKEEAPNKASSEKTAELFKQLNGSKNGAVFYKDIYTQLLPFVASMNEAVALIYLLERKQGIKIPLSRTIQIASATRRELSDDDIQSLIDMRAWWMAQTTKEDRRAIAKGLSWIATYIPQFLSKNQRLKPIVLGSLDPKILTKLTVTTDLLGPEDLKRILSKSPRLQEIIIIEPSSYKLEFSFEKLIETLGAAQLPNLEALRVKGHFTIGQLKEVMLKNPGLKKLYVSGCQSVTDELIEALPSSDQLEILEVAGTKISGRGVKLIMQKYPKLKKIDFAGNSIRFDGVEIDAIPISNQIEELNLKNMFLGNEEMEIWLQKCPYLRKIHYQRCVSNWPKPNSLNIHHHLKEIDLSGSEKIEKDFFDFWLARCPNLKSITFSYYYIYAKYFLEAIPVSDQIEEITIHSSEIANALLPRIAQRCHNIKQIHLNDCRFTQKSFEIIASLQQAFPTLKINIDKLSISALEDFEIQTRVTMQDILEHKRR